MVVRLECVCKVWTGHAAAVMCLAIGRSRGGDLVATGSKDHYVRTLDMLPQDMGEFCFYNIASVSLLGTCIVPLCGNL